MWIKPQRTIFYIVFLLTIAAGQFFLAGQCRGAVNDKQPVRYVSIDFNNVDLNVFIKFISELTGKNFVIDQRVKGKVTILSPSKISVEEAYKVFESVLEVHGYTTVKSGKIIKIVPSPDARSKSIKTLIQQENGTPEDKVVTQLIPLRYADSNEIKRLFAPLISKSSVILAYPPTNILIVTDVYSNILRLLRILKSIDVIGIGQELSVIPLTYANAVNFSKLLDSVFKKTTGAKKSDPEPDIRFVADERTNTVIVLASEDQTKRIKGLIAMLDRETPRGQDKFHVHYLEYAVAEDLAKMLQSLLTGQPKPASGKKEAPVVSEKVLITADKATNSLIISAGMEDYSVLLEIIKKLDIPRAMVYIEALIMEVNVEKNFNVGTEWVFAERTAVNDKLAAAGTAFRLNESDLITSTATGLPAPSGFSLGVFGESISIGGISFPNIQAIIKAYQQDKDVHILSTPQILTTDNEEAKIVVGKNVPFQTRTSTSENETFNTFEYRDVGKTLTITPQISKDRMVRLKLSLIVTDLESGAVVASQPTTLKRSVDTTVIVEDTNTVVIGGLIDDSFSRSKQQVPCLGDVPLLKTGFSSRASSNTKTNLYVFLTPRVIENTAEAAGVYEKKKNQIDKIKEGSMKMYKSSQN